jgi:hypothetical protein
MRVLVTGASGLIGSALVPLLGRQGHEVSRLVRRSPRGASEILWDPGGGTVDRAALEGFDAVIHLAGESIVSGRWTRDRKARIRGSRVRGTRFLSESLARLERPPRALISASAIGYYGDRGDEILHEGSGPGQGFLARLSLEWEDATEPAAARGIRVVLPRIGLVLAPAGGLLQRLLPIFRVGLGGPIGRGRAWWSWIALDDLIGIFEFALYREELRGAANAVAPRPASNAEFTRTLGRVLSRPALLPVPPSALRVAFGEMANEALLSSARAEPARLKEAGYSFRFPELDGALRHVLAKAA